ncbi:hypothetical protein SBA4_3100008 [Candidatus Sulfopaludibacter sp. SbA4]|nr:hypothetical protein SBA4_3100008 [Candidatus Sulfopaludibacter sp. SbA4]
MQRHPPADPNSDGGGDPCADSTATFCVMGTGQMPSDPQNALVPTPIISAPPNGIPGPAPWIGAVGEFITSVPGLFVGGFFTLFSGSTSGCDTLTCQGIMPPPPLVEAGRKGERRRTAKPDKPGRHAWPVDPKDPKTRWWVRDPQDPGKRILKPPGWTPDSGR